MLALAAWPRYGWLPRTYRNKLMQRRLIVKCVGMNSAKQQAMHHTQNGSRSTVNWTTL